MRNTLKPRRGQKKNDRAKLRNAARRQWRIDHPEHAGKQLNCWPLPDVD